MIYFLNALKEKVLNIQEQKGNVGRNSNKKKQKKMLESPNTTTEVNN